MHTLAQRPALKIGQAPAGVFPVATAVAIFWLARLGDKGDAL